jgi:hypothetical protein
VLPVLLAALGGVLAGAGVTVFWLTNTRTVFWLTNTRTGDRTVYDGSYAPLEPGSAYESGLSLDFAGWTVLWTGGHLLGAVLTVVGLLLLAAVGGWWLGSRRGRPGGAAG